jgi:hypothetical protein
MSSRPARELSARLREQRGFLETSCRDFDAGHESEAVRLAVTLRVLAHDTRASRSLLDYIGIKTSWQYLNLRSPPPADRGPWDGHVLVEASARPGGTTLTQPASDRGESYWTAFDQWWTTDLSRVGGRGFTRKDFVLVLANKEGGAHIDELSQGQRLLHENFGGWHSANLAMGTYARMTVRAIAEEMRQTIDTQFSASND